MRLHRFYVNKPLGEEIVVDSASGYGEEKEILHQWSNVFRFQSGDEVFLFSSFHSGLDHRYRFSSINKQKAVLLPISTVPNILPRSELTLVMALVKKDTFETIVRQGTELGVSRIIPLLASRSEKKNLNFDRLKAISIEASEQCGRGNVPEISEILTIEEAMGSTKGCMQIVGSLHGTAGDAISITSHPSIALWIGPEGGWTEEEENYFKQEGFERFRLTPTVLRADTAAVALLSAIQSKA